MLTARMARGLLGLCTMGTLIGCGDGPICPSEISLVIQSPADGLQLSASSDSKPDEAGIQSDVVVRTNLDAGVSVKLTITAAEGAVEELTAKVASDGNATFEGVTFAQGSIGLKAEASTDCGKGSDEATVTVITEADCGLSISEGLIESAFYAPIPVLNTSNDSDEALPNFQATVQVQTEPGFDVNVFVLDVQTGNEASLEDVTVNDQGLAEVAATLAQGRQVIRATCTKGNANEASPTMTVHVDTVAPTCAFVTPTAGPAVNPGADEDGDVDGIQQTWQATVDDAGEGDILGEETSFFLDDTEFAGTAIGEEGTFQTSGEFLSPGTFKIRAVAPDHAGNACTGASFDVSVVMDGCGIAISEPSAPVTADSNANGSDGMQATFTVDVSAGATAMVDCAGQEVFVDCGQGESSGIVSGDGTTTVADVTLSATAASEGSVNCIARVESPDGFTTQAQRTVTWDTLAPTVFLDFVQPAGLACGDSLVMNVANDANGDLGDGLQIDVRTIAPLAAEEEVVVINDACPDPGCLTAAGDGNVRITLEPGANNIVAVARDALGNERRTASCSVILTDIAVTFGAPISTGSLNRQDGTMNGDNLELQVCGTVSEDDVTLVVRVDDTTDYPTTVNAGAWCTDANVVFTEAPHTLVATAMSNIDTRQGSATAMVTTDVTPPDTPTGLVANDTTRQSMSVSWDATPGAASYVLRYSESVFVDFFNEGTDVAVGATTSTTVAQLDVGTMYYVGVAAVDAAGNVSNPTTVGPVIPLLDETGAVAPPGGAPSGLGRAMVSANFNGDAYSDLAASAHFSDVGATGTAGIVYVYLGSASGIGTTPNVTISGPPEFAQFGSGMTALNWGGGPNSGLAIGAPFANGTNGAVYIFHDTTIAAAAAGSGTLGVGDADMTIKVDPTANWFSTGAVGWSLAAGQIDAAGTPQDLVIGVPAGGGLTGGAVILYGGTPSTNNILLSNTSDAGLGGLVGHYFESPRAAGSGGLLGVNVFYLGDTRAGGGVGDVALSYFSDDVDLGAVDDEVYILRGRTSLPASGIAKTTLGATDLVLQHTDPDATNAFGESVASIQDRNSDGYRDIVISAWGQGTGEVWIVSGSLGGEVTLSGTEGFLTRISGSAGNVNFGGGVANNAIVVGGSDLDADGLEDLVVAGGRAGTGEAVQLYMWLGDEIPTGSTTSASASHQISAPPSYRGYTTPGQPGPLGVAWLHDINSDGLADLVWSDYLRDAGYFEVLWDAL